MYNFIEEVLRFDIDGPVPGVVLGYILPWNFDQMVFLQKVEKIPLLIIWKQRDIIEALCFRKTDTVEILLQLGASILVPACHFGDVAHESIRTPKTIENARNDINFSVVVGLIPACHKTMWGIGGKACDCNGISSYR